MGNIIDRNTSQMMVSLPPLRGKVGMGGGLALRGDPPPESGSAPLVPQVPEALRTASPSRGEENKRYYAWWLVASVLFWALPLWAKGGVVGNLKKSETPGRVVFISELKNPNDFTLFANGGWDGNWYVGFNNCWISKLPPIPSGNFKKAFLGAKLGRMKPRPSPERPRWEKEAIPGEIHMAVAQEPRWPNHHRFFLTLTQEIPVEGDAENALEDVGESRWFWVEVPFKLLSSTQDNFVAIYSPSENLVDAQHSPILAAGWGDKRANTWLNNAVNGEPPVDPGEALKTGVTYFDPGLAIKVVGGEISALEVRAQEPVESDTPEEHFYISASVLGQDIQCAWAEFSKDKKKWQKIGRAAWGAPYEFTVKKRELPAGRIYLRVGAKDVFEQKAWSSVFTETIVLKKEQEK